jgi:hypothetical protein
LKISNPIELERGKKKLNRRKTKKLELLPKLTTRTGFKIRNPGGKYGMRKKMKNLN